MAPFMADECLLALPEVDGLDYTMKEYNRLVEHVNACVTRLNAIRKFKKKLKRGLKKLLKT